MTDSFNHQNDKLFSNAFHYAAIGMALVAPNGTWLAVNNALCAITGYGQEELLRCTFQDITHPDDLEEDLAYVKQMLSGEIDSYQMKKRYFHKDGSIIHVLLSVSLVKDQAGAPLYFISQIQDITEQKNLELELIRQATEDMLTGVSNRRHFYDLAHHELIRGTRYSDPCVILMIDIDFFKKINDTFGHGIGDLALKKVATTCKAALREIDIFGRIGGEEFCAFLVKTDAATGLQIAERLRRAIEQLILPTDKGLVKLTVSIGGIAFIGNDQSLDHRMKQADECLYGAKEAGRNRVKMYDDIPLAKRTELQAGFVRLEWLRSYESGHPLIDKQHMQLFAKANTLLSSLLAKQDGATCQRHIDQLIAHIISHFTSEEQVLDKAGYPDLQEHKAIHQQLTARAADLARRHKLGKLDVTDLFHFLAIEVISQHMVEDDQKFFSWLHNQDS